LIASHRRLVRPVLLVALLAAGCGGSSSSSSGSIRALNAVSGAPLLDLTIDGTFAVGGIGLPGSSGYVARGAGSHAVALVASGTSQAVAQVTVPLVADELVTVVASGLPGGAPAPAATVFLDDGSAPAVGKARLRIIHAAGGSASLDLAATLRPEGSPTPAAPPLLVPFRTGGYFLEVPTGRYSLELVDNGTALVIATFPTGTLAAGTSTTALVVDAPAGSLLPVTVASFGDRR
jgi:hypothetical protein